MLPTSIGQLLLICKPPASGPSRSKSHGLAAFPVQSRAMEVACELAGPALEGWRAAFGHCRRSHHCRAAASHGNQQNGDRACARLPPSISAQVYKHMWALLVLEDTISASQPVHVARLLVPAPIVEPPSSQVSDGAGLPSSELLLCGGCLAQASTERSGRNLASNRKRCKIVGYHIYVGY